MLLPAFLYVLVSISLPQIAFIVVLMSKWRMFAVKIRHWPANIRANAVDIAVGFSSVVFMSQTNVTSIRILWAVFYGLWLVFLKPRSDLLFVSLQAMIGQLVGLVAIYQRLGSAGLYVLVPATWALCYFSARHFFTSFDEPLSRVMAYVWAYFAGSLAWVLWHWSLFYSSVPQIAVLLTLIGYSLAAMYYLQKTDRITPVKRRQFLAIMIAFVTIIIVMSDWDGL
jgi:hypothetical protein